MYTKNIVSAVVFLLFAKELLELMHRIKYTHTNAVNTKQIEWKMKIFFSFKQSVFWAHISFIEFSIWRLNLWQTKESWKTAARQKRKWIQILSFLLFFSKMGLRISSEAIYYTGAFCIKQPSKLDNLFQLV